MRRPAGASRNRWFDDNVTQSIERDAVELARVRQRQLLGHLLERLAGRTGQVLNLSAAGTCLVERLPVWDKTLRARTVAAPTLHVIDSGVAARLMRVSPGKLAGLDQTTFSDRLYVMPVDRLWRPIPELSGM